jgi:hypothetical protein
MYLANRAAKKAEDIKRRVKANPLADLSRFSNLDDLEILLGGNVPKNPPSSKKKNPTTDDNSGGGNQTPNPLEEPKEFFEQYQTQIFIAIALIGVLFYLYTQKDIEEDEDTKEDKKFMRQMMLMKAMNERNNSKNE